MSTYKPKKRYMLKSSYLQTVAFYFVLNTTILNLWHRLQFIVRETTLFAFKRYDDNLFVERNFSQQ